MDGKEDLVCETTIIKGLKNIKASGADSVVNDYFKNGSYEVRNKLLKIMNMIFEKGEAPSDFRKTLIKPLYKKGGKSKCGNYRAINVVFVSSKLLSIMIPFGLRDAVDKVIREEQCSLRKGRGCFDQIFTLS